MSIVVRDVERALERPTALEIIEGPMIVSYENLGIRIILRSTDYLFETFVRLIILYQNVTLAYASFPFQIVTDRPSCFNDV